jgi:hypothetical protein
MRLSAVLDPPMAKHHFSLVACARWEEMQIQEWLEYHKSIGFDHVYLYSNDEDPARLFRAVAPYTYGTEPFVTFRHWPRVGEQVPIYLHFLETFKHETHWFSFLDIDEFFVLKDVNNIALFMHDYRTSVDCLYFNWLVYGHSGKVKRDDGATLTSYLRRARTLDAHTKMICRSSAIDAGALRPISGRGSFWHFLDNFKLPGLRCRDVLHAPTDGYSADFPASAEPFLQREGYHEAVINRAYVAHFQFRSEEDFLRRWRRGGFPNGEHWRALYEAGAHKAIMAANNTVYDTYLASYWHAYTAPALNFGLQPPFGSPPHHNVALNKPSFQSSVFEFGDPDIGESSLSGRGNNGLRNGSYGFHTTLEAQHGGWLISSRPIVSPRSTFITAPIPLLAMRALRPGQMNSTSSSASMASTGRSCFRAPRRGLSAWTVLRWSFKAHRPFPTASSCCGCEGRTICTCRKSRFTVVRSKRRWPRRRPWHNGVSRPWSALSFTWSRMGGSRT